MGIIFFFRKTKRRKKKQIQKGETETVPRLKLVSLSVDGARSVDLSRERERFSPPSRFYSTRFWGEKIGNISPVTHKRDALIYRRNDI